MFNTWENFGLGEIEPVPVTAEIVGNGTAFGPTATITFRVTGAPDSGVLVEISKKTPGGNWEITQPTNWEGRRTDAAGVAVWSIGAPAAGEYRYRFVVPIVGLNYDPSASVDFRVVEVAVDDQILEEGGGFQIPQTITIAGVSMSPLMLVGLAGLAFLMLKGKK